MGADGPEKKGNKKEKANFGFWGFGWRDREASRLSTPFPIIFLMIFNGFFRGDGATGAPSGRC